MRAARHEQQAETDSVHFGSIEPVRVGMPELCRTGLSETWLWKACGHRHWLALASIHGLDRPEFRDAEGARLYPAFTDVRLEGGHLDWVVEDDRLEFDLTMRRISRTRYRSTITIRTQTLVIAEVALESVFVRRAIAGQNCSAKRGLVARPSGLLPSPTPEAPFRAQAWTEEHGFRRAERAALATVTLDPSPHEDFNGAGFLYCAVFQAIIDRAEWAWFRRMDPVLVTSARRIIYTGNMELGDRVIATLCGGREDPTQLASWVELARESDGAMIALSFAERVAGSGFRAD
jgi:probable biosynthetic protein (TIGR04099 family)